jgi:hypothetical protein
MMDIIFSLYLKSFLLNLIFAIYLIKPIINKIFMNKIIFFIL